MNAARANISDFFPDSAAIDRTAGSELRLKWDDVPAKCAVYVLAMDGEKGEDPLLLATVGNLRAALQRRLMDAPAEIKTKRIPYGEICGRVYWRVVHSAFSADYFYWLAARGLFPDTYKGIIPHRTTWWLAMEKAGGGAEFPRIRRTTDLSDASLMYAGPVREKGAGAKLIETAEDLFDLCRYYNILVQTPHGKPCAYKEMGKCPAPCDGSVPLTWYHTQIRAAFDFLSGVGRDAWFENTQIAMRSAAAAQEFELANRIKQRIARANYIHNEAFSFLRRLEDFSYLTIQPGQGRAHLEPWLIHGGKIWHMEQLKRKDLASGVEQLFAEVMKKTAAPISPPIPEEAAEQIAIAGHHLFRAEKNDGRFLRVSDVINGGSAIILRACESCFAEWNPPKPLMEQSSEKAPAEEKPDQPAKGAPEAENATGN